MEKKIYASIDWGSLRQQTLRRVINFSKKLSKGSRTGLDYDDCEEITQHVCAKVLFFLHTYNPEKGTLEQWMSTVIRNCVLDALKEKGRRIRTYKSIETPYDGEKSVSFDNVLSKYGNTPACDQEVICKDYTSLVSNALSEVSPRNRRLYRMKYDGYKPAELADMTGINSRTVSVNCHRTETKVQNSFIPIVGEAYSRKWSHKMPEREEYHSGDEIDAFEQDLHFTPARIIRHPGPSVA